MQYAPVHTKRINVLGLVLLIIEAAIVEFITAKLSCLLYAKKFS